MHLNNVTYITINDRDRVSRIMREFDFADVKIAMHKMDWRWGNEVPSLYDLMHTAETLLIEAIQSMHIVEMGGFSASFRQVGEGDPELSLTFNIESKVA